MPAPLSAALQYGRRHLGLAGGGGVGSWRDCGARPCSVSRVGRGGSGRHCRRTSASPAATLLRIPPHPPSLPSRDRRLPTSPARPPAAVPADIATRRRLAARAPDPPPPGPPRPPRSPRRRRAPRHRPPRAAAKSAAFHGAEIRTAPLGASPDEVPPFHLLPPLPGHTARSGRSPQSAGTPPHPDSDVHRAPLPGGSRYPSTLVLPPQRPPCDQQLLRWRTPPFCGCPFPTPPCCPLSAPPPASPGDWGGACGPPSSPRCPWWAFRPWRAARGGSSRGSLPPVPPCPWRPALGR
ncbi:hypothetical protein BU14_0190s0008 [Porphyra umbilicalis]|uniref:Uncharacterized protein n=1 Tax=Porphyra umbilicalis TaxID=2786 RepID=A0A1X6P6D1_PORUM|nr:hypothetical protein BU14_0190s0008 [Porphyra umbilicalis]|eukprot:OSX76451.1 hypothetical protein BU14_0190s0008 [Porphyra umbilicalis]